MTPITRQDILAHQTVAQAGSAIGQASHLWVLAAFRGQVPVTTGRRRPTHGAVPPASGFGCSQNKRPPKGPVPARRQSGNEPFSLSVINR